MKEYGTNELFETVKEVPTELSRQQVMEMISVIPTLPPPGNSWFNINLNSIIMTTTVVAIISTAVIYFSNPESPAELPGQEPESSASVTIVADEPETQHLSEDTLKVEPVASIPGPKADTASRADQKPDPVPVIQITDAKKSDETTSSPQPQTITQIPSTEESNKTTTAMEKVKKLKEGVSTKQSSVAIRTNPAPSKSVVNSAPLADNESGVSDDTEDIPLGKLKRALIRELYNDQIIPSKKPFMTVIEFKGPDVSVNFKALDKGHRDKYEGIFRKYQVSPGPNRHIVVDADFIMVGDFTRSGFLGSAKGKRMRISFSDTTVFFNSMNKSPGKGIKGKITYVPNGHKGESVTVFSDDDKGLLGNSSRTNETGDNGGLMISTEGDLRDAEGNTRSALLLTREETDVDVDRDKSYEIGNAVTMTNTDVDSPPVELNSLKIDKLKRTLYRYLVSDGQVENNRSDVNMVIGTGPFRVNSNSNFTSVLQEKYTELFHTFGVELRPGLKILMSTDFIFVGEFGEDNFNGSVQGMLDKEKIIGTVFEEDLGQYALFGNTKSDEVATENRPVEPFDKIRVSGLAVVYYTQERVKDLELTVSGMDIEDVITEVKDGELLVYTSPDKAINGESIKVFASSPVLTSIVVDDSGIFKSKSKIEGDKLKVSALGVGSVDLGVDVDRLHLIMDGGDIAVEGRAVMERTDFLIDANNGTLDQSGLRVLKNWKPGEKTSLGGNKLVNLKEKLAEKLFSDGFIESLRDKIAITFSTTSLEINKTEITVNKLIGYLQLFKEYGLALRNERRLYMGHDFIVIAERNEGRFEFEMRGNNLNFSAQDTWEELEEDIFNRD